MSCSFLQPLMSLVAVYPLVLQHSTLVAILFMSRGNIMFFLATTYVFSCNMATRFATKHIGGNIIYQSQ